MDLKVFSKKCLVSDFKSQLEHKLSSCFLHSLQENTNQYLEIGHFAKYET
jgi:hypothetical protein